MCINGQSYRVCRITEARVKTDTRWYSNAISNNCLMYSASSGWNGTGYDINIAHFPSSCTCQCTREPKINGFIMDNVVTSMVIHIHNC